MERPPTSSARAPGPAASASPAMLAGLTTPTTSTAGLSGLVCNVHRTTGREPHPLVGATTTVLGDKLYVFGGRRLSRSRPQLTSDLYELDLVKRHWTKLDTKGDIPAPRYFHSVCSLGDTKLVCYGGMSPAASPTNQSPAVMQGAPADAQPEVVVMSDIHIYDALTRTWMHVPSNDPPQGRYAHCATILPSSSVFGSTSAAMTAIRHNPPSANPNQGSLGVQLDGEGGAEMVVVGGQDSANHYIEQISVFNLRSLKWTETSTLGRSCGAYRSVVAPLTSINPNNIGAGTRQNGESRHPDEQLANTNGESSMLIYSNYNFLDVKLELQIRHPNGTLSEKPMHGSFSPPGLRFPNGGVINNHFVVSGTFLTSSKQEYALWALDLRTLSWGRIEAGGNIFSQGSWNRGVLWNRRNCFVILGNRKRSLVEDYNHRRINFSNMCVVELEAFGLYDNPRKVTPACGFQSGSAPPHSDRQDMLAGGRSLLPAATELGQMALGMRELADMEFLAIHGERIPVNSHLIARRWGPYFSQLLRESAHSDEKDNTDAATLRLTAQMHSVEKLQHHHHTIHQDQLLNSNHTHHQHNHPIRVNSCIIKFTFFYRSARIVVPLTFSTTASVVSTAHTPHSSKHSYTSCTHLRFHLPIRRYAHHKSSAPCSNLRDHITLTASWRPLLNDYMVYLTTGTQQPSSMLPPWLPVVVQVLLSLASTAWLPPMEPRMA